LFVVIGEINHSGPFDSGYKSKNIQSDHSFERKKNLRRYSFVLDGFPRQRSCLPEAPPDEPQMGAHSSRDQNNLTHPGVQSGGYLVREAESQEPAT